MTHPKAPYLVAAGVAPISFYRGLEAGPLSVVVPIFGLFLVGSSVVGVALFDETFSTRRAAAILMAVGAVYLVSTG